ncbi:hypothetical protein KC19_8G170500 [Ceratodon purpureus]|uniref:Glycoside hydrolase 123 catalytic domain-containing protein n=1 Tax=Ceratodon purpureus TaxID=3225 RepID=A0A8T0H4U5_CERPU|nr:hypothetical protein KC19_8G170500 [Ceratodon purpureus]
MMQNNVDYVAPPPVEGVGGGGTGYGWNDGPQIGGAVLGSEIDVARHATVDLVHVWCMPSTAMIGHQEPPRPLEQVSLLAARNERESAQIAMRPKVSWTSGDMVGYLQIQCSDFCSSSGDSLKAGKEVTIRRVVPILGVPDALVPISLPSRIGLLPGETSALWVSIDVPVEQPPGVYTGEVCITAVRAETEAAASEKVVCEKMEIKKDLQSYLAQAEAVGSKSTQELTQALQSICEGLHQVLQSPLLSASCGDFGKMEIDEESQSPPCIRVQFSITVWDFVLPTTPSLPAVVGISETVIEDRYNLEHGSKEWYKSLDMHFDWLLQYRLSPYFCRWGDNMRVLTYTCPYPATHPKSQDYYSNPRLAAYAVPYAPVLSSTDIAKNVVKSELEILKHEPHWKKAYFYLWDEPVGFDQYEIIRSMAEEIRTTAPDARVLTTYYCGPSDPSINLGGFESFVKVPTFLRPHTQIFCTSEWVLGGREDLVKQITDEIQLENDEEWWTYVCMGPGELHPNWHLGMRGTQHRAVIWRVWKEGGTGFLYWGVNCYEKATSPAAEIRFRRGLPPGDGVLFYPGEVFNVGATLPVASVRLERFLSGMQDYEYLQLYSSMYGRHEALALLEKTGTYSGPERYTLDHGPIESLRGEVYRAYRPIT